MTNTYLDNCLPVIAIDVAIEEKTRVAKMAATTLHKLHDAMQRMKEWREDSVKLKSSIWRMKMDLQVDDKLGKLEDQVVDPLITHQRAQINRLERMNNDLENQVTSLKDALSKAEGDAVPIREMGDQIIRIEEEFAHERDRLNDEILNLRMRLRETEEDQTLEYHFKEKLLEYAKGDRTIEIVLANMIGRVVETVVNLSEELVYVSEDLCRFKTKNRHLHLKLDRLRAMLRTRCGGSAEYRKRIDELSNLAARLLGQMDRLKVIREKARHGDIPDVIRQVECLMGDLKNRLRSEHEALIAGGDPDCLRYMKKVIDLRVNLRVLSVELRQSNASVLERPRATVQRDHWRTATLLNEFLQRIDLEIGRFRMKPISRYCRIGGISGARYAAKVAELEVMVKRLIGVVVTLKQSSPSEADGATTSGKATEELADSIERLCGKIKDLDVLDDRAGLRERIDRLEGSLTRLKLEVATRDERICALSDDHAIVKSSLMKDHERQGEIVVDLRAENDILREDINNEKREISGLSRKRERSARRVTEMRLMKAEIDATKKTLQDHHHDRESLLRETEGMRDILRDREKEIEDIVTERDALRQRLEAEVMELRTKLEIASDENIKLKSGTIARIGEQQTDNGRITAADEERTNDERDSDEIARNLRDELKRLRAESNEARISLNNANEQIDHFRRSLNKVAFDRTRLEGEISELRSNEKSLTHRLKLRTSACEAATRESERAAAENKQLAVKLKHVRRENEKLIAQLSLLRCEKERLAGAMANADEERVALRRQLDEATCQLSKMREDEVEMTRLRQENTALVSDLKTGSARYSDTEERVRLLLTEKNELVTRINEVDAENDALRERLNKAEEENEYFSIELNKSRLENDRARTRNGLLQVTCEKRERDNNDLRKERDHVRVKLHEVGSECRILGNQLAIQRMKYEALRFTAVTLYHENNDRTSHLKKIDTRYPLARPRDRGGFATAGNDVKHKRDYSDAARVGINVELGELGDVEFKAESDAHADPDNKDKIKDKPKGDELKSLTDKSLEIADLRSEVCQFTDSEQSARTKGELKEPLVMEGPGIEEIINSVLGRHEIVNICYKRETNEYADYHRDDNAMIFAREMNPRWSAIVAIDQLEIENSALKMEMNILRNSLNCSVIESEKAKLDVARASEEIQALRLELMNTRDEKAALRSRFEMHKGEVNALRSERVALKNELAVLRKSNFDLRLKANNPRVAHENPNDTRIANDPENRNLQETSGSANLPLVESATS